MAVAYRPVQWNRNKLVYDAVLVVGVTAYILLFLRLAPGWLDAPAIGGAELRMRAFGSCAYIMLHLILIIGPLARLDHRFLPMVYNRRHFGVALFFVGLAHAWYVTGWYQAFSPVDKYVGVLVGNTNVSSFIGFPFEYLGVAALLILFVMAATSHDFWLNFLGAPAWKAIHMAVYAAYGLLVMHVTLGLLQSEKGLVYPLLIGAGVLLVVVLHLMAALKEARDDAANPSGAAHPVEDDDTPWIFAARISEMQADRGVAVLLPDGERAAVFRHGDRISALSNACMHQNGPLSEGRVIDGCVTCPWHGYQYRPEDGCSPPPFTEKVPTFRVRRDGDLVLLDPRALPPGTATDPIILENAG
jgi:nitrite reductase/ring-hydroxylating ferredoxin subunit/DMSO/TMAO reductase YedYZ heme-binding membrane subunit